MKVQLGPTNIFFPVPAALVVTGSMEKPNIITIAWIGMMSESPPTIAIIGGAFLAEQIGSPVAVLFVLVILKTIMDVALHLREHKKIKKKMAAGQ